MASRNITQMHLNNMRDMLSVVNTVLDLDIEEAERRLLASGKKKYPKPSHGFAVSAVDDKENIFHPYQVMVGCASSPHHLNVDAPMIALEFTKPSATHGMDILFSWVVFPKSRQILTISGLVLDTHGKRSAYTKDSLYEHRNVLQIEARRKIADIIRLFPTEEKSEEEGFVFDAVADLLRP